MISQKDPHLKNQLMKVKEQLRSELLNTTKQLGVNTQGLKFIKQQWKLQHASEFIDDEEEEQRKQIEEKKSNKRSHANV